jgi:hypothetical protein
VSTVGGNPAPGWYTNPANSAEERWWDGVQWSSTVRPGAPAQPAYAATEYPQQTYAAPSHGGAQAQSYGAPAQQYGAAVTPAAPAAGSAFDFSTPRALEATAPEPTYGAAQPYGAQSYGGIGGGQAAPLAGADDYSWASTTTVAKDNWYEKEAMYSGSKPSNPAAVVGFVLAMLGFGLVAVIVSSFGRKKATQLQNEGQQPVGRALARWGTALGTIQLVALLALSAYAYNFFTTGYGYDRAKFESEMSQGYEQAGGEPLREIRCPTNGSLQPGTSMDCHVTTANGQNLLVHITFNALGEDPTVTAEQE